ncbi:hypothetical protein FXO38_13035 [Capsicum annuum]|nr:hypothetical protein FXO37_15018 [Capsicum annuum]KAF3658756.1 hypothetical protein FXO38_13035 [Capsicum annuum]
MKCTEQLQRHMKKCDLKHPPGDKIYRSGTLSMFEVDGKKNKVYGQNYATGPNCFLIIRLCIMMLTCSSFICFMNVTTEVAIWGYWTHVLLDILKKLRGNISIKELSDLIAIKAEDILSTLQGLELIQYRKGQQVICADPKVLDCHRKAAGWGGREVDVSKSELLRQKIGVCIS